MRGEDLRAAADEVAALALSHGLALRACNDTGERMVGAALVLHPACVLTDTTTRHDGLDVLLVSGAVSDAFGLMRAARLASNLGARTVRAAVLGGWPGDVAALDEPVIEVGLRSAPAACWACVFDSEPEHSCGGMPADLIPGFHRAF